MNPADPEGLRLPPLPEGWITPDDVKLGQRFGEGLDPRDPATIGKRGFFLEVDGHNPIRCHFAPTEGMTGFGPRKRRTTYPSGKIVIEWGDGSTSGAASLDSAREKVCARMNADLGAAPDEPEAPGMRR